VNIALEGDDWETTYEMLRHNDISIDSLIPECGQTYHEELAGMRKEKAEADCQDTTWIAYPAEGDVPYYFDTLNLAGQWDKPDDFQANTTHLTTEEIQECVRYISNAYDRVTMWRENEALIIKLQSYARMYTARKAYLQRKKYIESQIDEIVTIQSMWRGNKQRKEYLDRLEYFRSNVDAIIKIQKWYRMTVLRKRYLQRRKYFHNQVKYIVKLQAWFRSNKARHDYKTLIGTDLIPLPVVQRFISLLDQSATDFAEEIELQELKQKVVSSIKSNAEREQALNTMDIKIGLLVKNRISLQDVISHSQNLRKKAKDKDLDGSGDNNTPAGLKSLNKANRARLEGYQNLFYLLQTNPIYLGKLIFKMAAGRTNNFMQSVIYSVYNYASNAREEYLLLKLFRTALQEEIESKVDKMKEIATGNPLVIRMVVSFNRGQKGTSCLREMFEKLVLDVMNNKNLNINNDPIEIYKSWINQTETETGEASTLPYNVDVAQALEHEEVRTRHENSINQLRNISDGFLNAILKSVDTIPYGLRYICKCLRDLLRAKFPDSPDEEVQKMVGNLIYYRFMNPVIVNPMGFDVIDQTAGSTGPTQDQLRNLGLIAKILQFSSTGKTFVGEHDYHRALNEYITESYEKFKKILPSCM